MNADADRYIWLIAHMGRVTEYAKSWNPATDKPFLRFIQDFIDAEMSKESSTWFAMQRKMLEEK